MIPPSELRSSADPALTAFAQLTTLRLNASRALISLFDSQSQYIIAEATPDLTLIPRAKSEPGGPQLWLCGTAIPRSLSICDHVLVPPDPPLTSNEGTSADADDLPVTVICDLAEHPDLLASSRCASWPHNRFYAGVPIKSRRGINIGVLCIFDDKPRHGLDEVSIRVMRDMSETIFRHLKSKRSRIGHRRSERMVRGLGSFVEGKATTSQWIKPQAVGETPTSEADQEGILDSTLR